MAFFTGPDWHWDEAKLEDASTPSLQHLTTITTGVILVQLILGAVYRHSKEGIIAPHVVGACVVTLLVGWVVSTVLMRLRKAAGPAASLRCCWGDCWWCNSFSASVRTL